MFECPSPNQDQQSGFNSYMRQLPAEHKNMVAKKFWVKKVRKNMFAFDVFFAPES
jgi:hypothetical protein